MALIIQELWQIPGKLTRKLNSKRNIFKVLNVCFVEQKKHNSNWMFINHMWSNPSPLFQIDGEKNL